MKRKKERKNFRTQCASGRHNVCLVTIYCLKMVKPFSFSGCKLVMTKIDLLLLSGPFTSLANSSDAIFGATGAIPSLERSYRATLGRNTVLDLRVREWKLAFTNYLGKWLPNCLNQSLLPHWTSMDELSVDLLLIVGIEILDCCYAQRSPHKRMLLYFEEVLKMSRIVTSSPVCHLPSICMYK